MAGRTVTDNYRYGFNGMEKELATEGYSFTHFRLLDHRIGRWFSIDPKFRIMPWETTYSFAFNNPVFGSDPRGDFCSPCAQFVIGFALDVISQVAHKVINEGKDWGEALSEVNYWSSTAAGGLAFVNPGAAFTQAISNPVIRKITAEMIEVLADMAHSALAGFTNEESDFDVYEVLAEGLLGAPTRGIARQLPDAPLPKLNKRIKTTQGNVDRLQRLTSGAYARTTRLDELKSMGREMNRLIQNKDFVNDLIQEASQKGLVTAIKLAVQSHPLYGGVSKYQTHNDDGSVFQEVIVEKDASGQKTSSKTKANF
jgi:RHS repeat-associated protein